MVPENHTCSIHLGSLLHALNRSDSDWVYWTTLQKISIPSQWRKLHIGPPPPQPPGIFHFRGIFLTLKPSENPQILDTPHSPLEEFAFEISSEMNYMRNLKANLENLRSEEHMPYSLTGRVCQEVVNTPTTLNIERIVAFFIYPCSLTTNCCIAIHISKLILFHL